MTTQEQINAMTKTELGLFLAPLTELASKMILAGVLKKNVVKHFINKGLSLDASENIVLAASIKAGKLMVYKAK